MNQYLKYINSDTWRNKSKAFRNVMLNRCSVMPFLRSSDGHHMTYANLEHEIFLRDVVPLSKAVHGTVHNISIAFFLKHDNHFIRFFINWLLLRPSCLFWFVTLTVLNLASKFVGRKNIAIVSMASAFTFGYMAIVTTKYQLIYGFLCFVFANFYFVFTPNIKLQIKPR